VANVAYSITPSAITVVVGNRPKVVTSRATNYAALADALRQPVHDVDLIAELADISTFIARVTHGDVQIADGNVRWRGEAVKNVVAERLIDLLKGGHDLTSLANFLGRLMLNPLQSTRDELFLWLESGNQPITPEGMILAFKKVREDYRDMHSGSIDNSVGQQPTMPREQVDADRNRECSVGLHFCSFGYLAHFGSNGRGEHIMIVLVDPADVVAIPKNYNNQKGRTWTYKVIGEVETANAGTFFQDSPVVQPYVSQTALLVEDPEGLDEGIDEDEDEDGVDGEEIPGTDDDDDDGEVVGEQAHGKPALMFNHGGRSFLASEVSKLLTDNGQRGASRLTGIPRTTLQEWNKAIIAQA